MNEVKHIYLTCLFDYHFGCVRAFLATKIVSSLLIKMTKMTTTNCNLPLLNQTYNQRFILST